MIGNSREAEKYCMSLPAGERLENFFVVALNAKCNILGRRKNRDPVPECFAIGTKRGGPGEPEEPSPWFSFSMFLFVTFACNGNFAIYNIKTAFYMNLQIADIYLL